VTSYPAEHHQYFWWIDTERPGRFYAMGNYGQYVYVAPDADTVIVRLGRGWESTIRPGWRRSVASPTTAHRVTSGP
jgi:CubicO group peptidase (beta-lactamase class C family)